MSAAGCRVAILALTLQLDGGTARERTSVSLTVGVTGPPSLAGSTQREFHHLIPGFYEPIGWEHQLPTEPAFALAAARSWRIAPVGPAGRHVDLVPAIGGSMGTLRTGGAAGIRMRAGTSLAHPWHASDRPALAPYVFAGASAEAVIWDLFLDGTVFRQSLSTTHKPLVGQWEYGAGVWVHRFGLEYGSVTRTRQFRAGPPTHTYGSFRLSWTLR
ncbi:MAG TPA: lipid A deacylase LpxR family protein [Vicinamibacterales bacterium]